MPANLGYAHPACRVSSLGNGILRIPGGRPVDVCDGCQADGRDGRLAGVFFFWHGERPLDASAACWGYPRDGHGGGIPGLPNCTRGVAPNGDLGQVDPVVIWTSAVARLD
jgi:hypothetical protein